MTWIRTFSYEDGDEKLRAALAVPRKRVATRPTKAAREQRLEEKRRRATTKRLRRPPADE